jgi:hypothetical protein
VKLAARQILATDERLEMVVRDEMTKVVEVKQIDGEAKPPRRGLWERPRISWNRRRRMPQVSLESTPEMKKAWVAAAKARPYEMT